MADVLQQRLFDCIDDVALWMMSNRLQLNHAKTEVLWCASARRQQQIPTGPVRVGSTSMFPATTVRDLGVYLNADVSMAETPKCCRHAQDRLESVVGDV